MRKIFLKAIFPHSRNLFLNFPYKIICHCFTWYHWLRKFPILFFSQASERFGLLNPQIWLANHAHMTGPAFNDTAHGPDFFPLNAVPKFRSWKLVVIINLLPVLPFHWQGVKLAYFFGSHLAPKYFKVVANSKKLVVIMKHTQTIFTLSLGHHCTREIKLVIDISCCQNIRSSYKKDTTMCHIQRERSPKSKMVSSDNDRFTFKIVHVLHFRNRLNKELCCRFIFTNL